MRRHSNNRQCLPADPSLFFCLSLHFMSLFLVLYMCNLLLLSLASFFCRLYLRGLYFFLSPFNSIQSNEYVHPLSFSSFFPLISPLTSSSSICASFFLSLSPMRLSPSNDQQDRNSNGIDLQQRTRRQLYMCVSMCVCLVENGSLLRW